MEVIGLQVFVSLMLVVGSVMLFAFSAKHRDHEHGDRLALLPLENDSQHPFDSDAHGASAPGAEVAKHGLEIE